MFNALSDTFNGVHSWLLEYICKCKNGEIIVGHELMQMLDILLSHFKDESIKVDFADAHKRIKFIETKCKHSEAPSAGKPFILELFQKAFIEAFYSFKIYDDELGRWVRKYQDFLLVIGRKNGKTPLVSAIDLAEFFCGPMGTKILCSSNDYDQADLMFQAIDAMREQSPSLSKVTRKNIKGIFFGNPKKPKHTGKFSYKNKGCIKKISAKTGAKEGKNIAVGSVDETHELKDNSSIMPIRQALSTQDEPIYGEMTTEGFTNDGYLDQRMIDARKVLNGQLERPRWLIWIYTQDSEAEIWQDEKTWVKSNPGLGVIKKWSYLRGMVEEAKTSKSTRAYVLAKDFNIKQNNAAAWLTKNELANEATFDPEILRGCVGIGAVDLAETTDLVSARMTVMRPGDRTKYTIQKYFIPESKLEKSPDDVDYLEWARQGLIEISPGNDNDFSLITQWFVKTVKQYGIRPYKIGYDNALAKYWVKDMETTGFDMERIPQKREVMSTPMKLLEADLQSKLFNYNYNPIDKWCLENTAMDIDKLGQIMPVKVQGNQIKRIDGTVTMIITNAVLVQYRSEYMKLVG
ncbi:terminase large subunit [Desulfosporosinus sp. PR]|uniref:terminase large subunit n=1 Tax=Candidatus Desulfosporosinus nitrosoreducens TaxID=3401928 RepID=UPI0027EA1E4B|nr:terminase TerL endonuclease subunit [Desulfosporosinus sp. PR]MDQ7095953.1 terminase large subunit [Desulfosporosinus sp. PR]